MYKEEAVDILNRGHMEYKTEGIPYLEITCPGEKIGDPGQGSEALKRLDVKETPLEDIARCAPAGRFKRDLTDKIEAGVHKVSGTEVIQKLQDAGVNIPKGIPGIQYGAEQPTWTGREEKRPFKGNAQGC